MFVFNSFRLDVANSSLSRGKQTILLTPKAFSVLRYLVEHAGQLVKKDDLWGAVWPGVAVTDAALTVCMSEIRKALGDDPKTPRYIETVHRLGYRFIAPVSTGPVEIVGSEIPGRNPVPSHSLRLSNPGFVGREAELGQLDKWWERALAGERQIVFVTGEPGIGKTTLVEEFLRQERVTGGKNLWIGRGQCIEHYGAGEAYLPLLDALGRLCREPGGGRLAELLDKHAPTWLAQMPSLPGIAEWNALQRRVTGATRERMLRELADAIEIISQERPLVLRLEDLHWSDYSTLEWLGFLARREEAARVLVLGTYRPVEVIVREHPLKHLKHELQLHRLCKELSLPLLSEAAVIEYLNLRFAFSNSFSGEYRAESHVQEPIRKLAQAIYECTDGNPLFMVNVIDYLVEREVLKPVGDGASVRPAEAIVPHSIDTPPSLVQMIEHNLERLNPEEQEVLEAASVTGIEFPAAAVAAALQRPINDIEAYCTKLARRQQFIHSQGIEELPDGTVTATFRFLHGLYRDVLYDRVPPARRLELHRRIAERGEEAYGENVGDVAVELAYHYRLGGNRTKTVKYLELAGERATALRAYHEAERHYRDAIEVLCALPESRERLRREMSLLLVLGNILVATRGSSAVETAEVYGRARSVAELAGRSDSVPMLFGQTVATVSQGELQAAGAINRQIFEIADGNPSSQALFLAHTAHGTVCYFVGNLIEAQEHLAQAGQHNCGLDLRGLPHTPAITRFFVSGPTEWHLGYPDRAVRQMGEMLALARLINDPISLCIAYYGAGLVYQLTADWARMLQASEEALRLSGTLRYPLITAAAEIHFAYSRAQMGETCGAAERIREALSELTTVKYFLMRGMLLGWLTEVHILTGNMAEAMITVEQALRFNTEELLFQPELLRLRGELCLRGGFGRAAMFEMAKQDFRAAIDAARAMSAKSDELHATTSLARLLARLGRHDEARMMLAEIYNWFTEGFDTADLREARLLLDELNQ